MAKEALFGHKEIAKIVNKKTFLVVSGGGETICDNSFLGRFFSDIPNASPLTGRHFRERYRTLLQLSIPNLHIIM